MPLFIADYLADTRNLPANVKGIWMDLICYLWNSPDRGELDGTLDEISRMVGCDKEEAKFALILLKEKRTADIEILPDGRWKIISRRMVRQVDISQKRAKAGKKSAKNKRNFAGEFVGTKQPTKPQQTIDIDLDLTLNNKKEPAKISKVILPFDTPAFREKWEQWKTYRKQIKEPIKSEIGEQAALKKLSKHPEATAIRMIDQSMENNWKGLFELKNDSNGKSTNKHQQRIEGVIVDYAQRYYPDAVNPGHGQSFGGAPVED